MIPSTTSKIDSSASLDPVKSQAAKSNPKSTPMGDDEFSASKTEGLMRMLEANPTIRPEVLQRARNLANDPAYPPIEVMRKISDILIKSEDPSEKQD